MKKRYALTLLEIMIVILIIGLVGSVLGYSMRGSLDKGKYFKTKEAIKKVYEIVSIEIALGRTIDKSGEEQMRESVAKLLEGSGLVKKVEDFTKDGWGQPFHFVWDNATDELHITSNKYQDYCNEKQLPLEYPWKESASQNAKNITNSESTTTP